ADAVEIRKFHPARDIPNNVHGAWSQRTRGASRMAWSGSPPEPAVFAQAVKPSHQPYSTPAWKAPISPETRIATAANAIHSRRGEATVETRANAMPAKCGHRCHQHISHG